MGSLLLPTISFRRLHGILVLQINIVVAAVFSPAEDFLEQGQHPVVLQAFLEVNLVLLLLHAHFVEGVVVLGDAQVVEVVHRDEVLADVAAFQSPGEVVGHEPANHVATRGDDLAYDVIFHLLVARDGDVVLLHDGENRLAVAPLVELNLLYDLLRFSVFDAAGVTDVSKRGGLLRGVGELEEFDERRVVEFHGLTVSLF